MYVETYKLIVPVHLALPKAALATSDTIQAFSGTKAMQSFGVSVQGSGASVTGELGPGTITTYDYTALYQVYNIPTTESAHYWFVSYSKDTSQGVLKQTFADSQTATVPFDVKFTLTGNNQGVTSVYLTFAVIRLTVNGVSKDFTCTNAANAGANNADGTPYAGGFTAVQGATA